MSEEELRAFIRDKMKKSMSEGLNPLISQIVELISSAYETGFWAGFEIGQSVEPKEDEK